MGWPTKQLLAGTNVLMDFKTKRYHDFFMSAWKSIPLSHRGTIAEGLARVTDRTDESFWDEGGLAIPFPYINSVAYDPNSRGLYIHPRRLAGVTPQLIKKLIGHRLACCLLFVLSSGAPATNVQSIYTNAYLIHQTYGPFHDRKRTYESSESLNKVYLQLSTCNNGE